MVKPIQLLTHSPSRVVLFTIYHKCGNTQIKKTRESCFVIQIWFRREKRIRYTDRTSDILNFYGEKESARVRWLLIWILCANPSNCNQQLCVVSGQENWDKTCLILRGCEQQRNIFQTCRYIPSSHLVFNLSLVLPLQIVSRLTR